MLVKELKNILKNYSDDCRVLVGTKDTYIEIISTCPNDIGLTLNTYPCEECNND